VHFQKHSKWEGPGAADLDAGAFFLQQDCIWDAYGGILLDKEAPDMATVQRRMNQDCFGTWVNVCECDDIRPRA
jgi:hypothetical protein